tara:strand:+ start:3550 stop:4434 length:885 start_codon:yes stop_codon:yes gene_type:complete
MGDSVTVNSMNIAEITNKQVWLKSLLGIYELGFNFSLRGPSERDGKSRWAKIHSARVQVNTKHNGQLDLGLARLETPLALKTHAEHSITAQMTAFLTLTNIQLSKLEEVRDGHDLEFKLIIKGVGGDGQHENPVYDEWRVEIPRSKWIEILRQSGYMDIMLLEVPMLPKGEVSDDWLDVKAELEEAQDSFLNRKYASCVAQCRKVLEDSGYIKFGEHNWYNPSLNLIGKDKRSTEKGKPNRESMSKESRENAIWASLFHYTHQANHGRSKGGESGYSREEAKTILTLTAIFVGR